MPNRHTRFRVAAAGALALAAAYGAWRVLAGPAPFDDALVARLADLGYADWTELEGDAPAPRGVDLYDPGRAWPGLNLYCSHARPGATLVDMRGEVVHRWRLAGDAARWDHAELTPEGDLLVIVLDPPSYLMSLDWDSNVRWKRTIPAHHDVSRTPDGSIHTLGSRIIEVPYAGRALPVIDNTLVWFSEGGEELREISLYALFGARVPEQRMLKLDRHVRRLGTKARRWLGWFDRKAYRMDLLHVNSLQLLDRHVEGLGRAGDALIAVRELDLIAVVDREREAVVFAWGPHELDRPHHPTLLEDGNVLIFDNGSRRKYSRVVELDPRSRTIVWQYVAEPRSDFFSGYQGAAQKLPNGNVLITESLRGRAFEVTRDGEPVWRFHDPEVDEGRRRRAEIYRMTRLEPAYVEAARARSTARAR
jgi:hypothetical protein